MAIDRKYLRATDGTGVAVTAHVDVERLPGATTLVVDNLENWPPFFIATSGTPNAQGYITGDTIKEFRGHIESGNIIIDGFEPGFVDTGNTTDQVVVVKQTAGWANGMIDSMDDFFDEVGRGWVNLDVAPSVVAQNGNRSTDISIPGDLTDTLSKGMKLRIPRTGTTPTQSANFNGTTQYLSKASPTGITGTGSITLEAWSYPTAIDSDRMLVSRVNSGGTIGWYLVQTSNGQIKFYGGTASGASTSRHFTTNSSVATNRFVHISVSVTMSTGALKIYFDGVEQPGTLVGTGTSLTQSGDLYIGNYSGLSNYYKGRLSDVRIWSTARTEAQIRDNMNQQLVGTETNLVGYWKLNGNFNDSTANANNFTAVGGVTATYADNPFNENAYAIVMTTPVHSGGNTTMAVQTPIGYPIPNQTLEAASYSAVKTPFGFPVQKDKWQVTFLSLVTTVIASPVVGTWYNMDIRIYLPKGGWQVRYQISHALLCGSSTSVRWQVSLATNTTSEDVTMTSYSGSTIPSTTVGISTDTRSKEYELTSPTTLYLNMMTTTSAATSLQTLGASAASQIIAECAYL